MNIQVKRRIAFALTMGLVTTGIISFVLLAISIGFSPEFWMKWLRSWGIGYVVVIPAILLIGPRLQGWLERLIK
jgi:hypothetical protein